MPLRYCEIHWKTGHCLRVLCAMTIKLNTTKVPPTTGNEHSITIQSNFHRSRGGTASRIAIQETTYR